jgi:hypothetical protein
VSIATSPGRRPFRPTALFVVCLSGLASAVLGQAPPQVEATMKKMLVATQENSYEDFVADGDSTFKGGMTRQMLDGVNQQLGPRLKAGYTVSYLGKLNQHGFAVHLWRIEFKDGKDDLLATMSVKDGKVGGFWLR